MCIEIDFGIKKKQLYSKVPNLLLENKLNSGAPGWLVTGRKKGYIEWWQTTLTGLRIVPINLFLGFLCALKSRRKREHTTRPLFLPSVAQELHFKLFLHFFLFQAFEHELQSCPVPAPVRISGLGNSRNHWSKFQRYSGSGRAGFRSTQVASHSEGMFERDGSSLKVSKVAKKKKTCEGK